MSNGMTSVPTPGPLADWQHVEPVCIAFEEAWQRGERPALGDFLERGPQSARLLLFEELLRVELFFLRSAGETVTPELYQARFPEWARVVEQVFAAEPRLATRGDFVPDALVHRYRIVRELGRGGFGVVYLAHDEELGRDVAIKIAGDGQRATAQQTARLLEEVRAAAGLRHPGIVAVYDVQPLADSGIFAVLEYINGQPLSAIALDAPDYHATAKRFAEISDAVAYAHARGFVHRDLHPGNILIDDNGAPHVADFGLAVHEDVQPRLAGERAGSLPYMSPEQVRGESHRLDGRSDIWSLGAMLYEQLSGRPPFAGDSPEQIADEILRREPRPPRQIRSDIPAALERICLRCLAKRVEDRFSTAGDLANALRAASHRPTRSRRVVLGTVCLLLLVGCGVIGAWRLPSFVAQRSAVLDRFRMQLLVWKHGRWENVHTPGVLPLRSGDQLRIHAESSLPRYLYVVWLDTDQQPSAVFPWRQGDWHVRNEEHPRTRLALPEGGPDEVWSMRVAGRGCEMVLLLGRDTPLPDDALLAEQLANLPVLAHYPTTGARFSFDELTTLSTTRDFNVAYTERIRDPLVVLQRELKERLEGLFSVMDCLVLPVDVAHPRQ